MIPGQSSRRSRSSIRRFARKSSRFGGWLMFPCTAEGEPRANAPDPEDRGPAEGTTRLRAGCAGGCCREWFAATRPARLWTEEDDTEAIVSSPRGVWGEVRSSGASELWSELGQERLCGEVAGVNKWVMGSQIRTVQ